ncbi:MAG: hypothetical protein JXR96_20200 [Deltaproteobacteria bacterium]|nr:hypothetical protein [Deltaproteobacteria bacterium]
MRRQLDLCIPLCLCLSIACQQAPRPRAEIRHPQALPAMARCVQGFAELARSSVRPEDMSAILAEACAGLFVEPGCSRAWKDLAPQPPDQRSAALIAACREAYCPLLSGPRPALCDAEIPDGHTERLLVWTQLLWAILRHDLGPDRAAELYASLVVYAILLEPIAVHTEPIALPAVPEPRAITLQVAVEQGSLHISLPGPGRTWSMTTQPEQPELEPLVEFLRGLPDRPDRAVIMASRDCSYRVVVAVMDALQRAGISQLALSAQP